MAPFSDRIQIVKFLLVGVANTLVGAGVMFALYNLAHCSYWLSSAANYVAGGMVSFFLNKHFTFQNDEKSFAQILVFALNTAVCYLIAYIGAKNLARLSQELAKRLYAAGADSGTPVFIYGIHKSPAGIHGEVAGFSPFEWISPGSERDATDRALAFMRTQGYFFTPLATDDTALLKKARGHAQTMPDFPDTGSVQNLGDAVVIRLSETSYKGDD